MKEYTVAEYTITYGSISMENVRTFATIEEAREAFAAVDLRGQWVTEKNCSPSLAIAKSKIMAVELIEGELDEDGEPLETDIIDYAEYGFASYEAEEEDAIGF